MNLSIKASPKWNIVAVLLFISFLLFTPLTTYNSFGVWLAMLESLVCAFFVFIGIMELETIKDVLYINEEHKEKLEESKVVYVPLTCFVVGGMLLFLILDNRLDNEINKNGVFTKAVVIDGQRSVSKSIRRQTETNKLTISFSSKDGKDHVYSTKISREIFQSVSKGLEIEVKYLPDHPELFKIIVGNENVRKFKNISNRDLTFIDLEKLLELNQQEVASYLDSISEGWTITDDDNGHIYSNDLKKEIIAISKNGEIIFRGSGANQPDQFIPKDKVLKQTNSIEKNTNGYALLKRTTFELEKLKIVHIFAIKNTDVRISMVISRK